MQHLVFSLAAIMLVFVAKGQSKLKVANDGVSVSDGTENAPDPNIVLDVSSSSKGVLLPLLTTEQRNQMENPPEGTIVYNLDTHNIEVFNGTKWFLLYGSAAPDYVDTGSIELDGYNDQLKRLGISVTRPDVITIIGTFKMSAVEYTGNHLWLFVLVLEVTGWTCELGFT